MRPSVAKDNPMRLIYQVQVVTKDKRLEQPSSGKLKQYSPSAEERVRVSASLYQFGATEDGNMLQHPLRFDVIIKWDLSETGCPPLGCPVLDPREKHNELFNRSVSLKSGEFLTPRKLQKGTIFTTRKYTASRIYGLSACAIWSIFGWSRFWIYGQFSRLLRPVSRL